ncbi:MAG TPA: phosphatidate cytidylyltransferase [Anaerolineae bacterium]|nr:phosphatidate cytidylyltransferase [Anaerolineae bacterium]HQI84260.1 phosphatidate cytidylyltransferase [Anaerolineae bacterium]
MTKNDIIGLIASYLYAFGLLFIVEAIGKRLKWPQAFTRKIIHISAGMWIWGILALFDTWYYGIIPFATFIVLNFVFYRFQIFKAMDAVDSSPGTVYFAISITLLFALLWRTGGALDRVPIAAAAVMAMTWGDGLASIVGLKYGKHPYTTFGHTRSWQGSIAMVIAAFVVILLTLAWLPGSALSPNSARLPLWSVLLSSVIGASVAAVAEGFSPAGTDNLSVPLLTGLVLFALNALPGG